MRKKLKRHDATTPRLFGAKNYSLYALTQHGRVEVNQQPQVMTSEFEIALKLSLMNLEQGFDSLYLHNQSSLHYQVQAQSSLQLQALIDDGDKDLGLYFDAPLLQFVNQALFIDRFKQSGPECPVNFERSIQNRFSQFIELFAWLNQLSFWPWRRGVMAFYHFQKSYICGAAV
jgi:hypothetical protein